MRRICHLPQRTQRFTQSDTEKLYYKIANYSIKKIVASVKTSVTSVVKEKLNLNLQPNLALKLIFIL
jgi:hypothetical protein